MTILFGVPHGKTHRTAKRSLTHTAIKYTTASHTLLKQGPERACHFLDHREKFMRGAGTLQSHPIPPRC